MMLIPWGGDDDDEAVAPVRRFRLPSIEIEGEVSLWKFGCMICICYRILMNE